MQIIETNLSFGGLKKRSRTTRTILHHSDSGDIPASVIHQWHLNQGWAGMGYHYLIHPDGRTERGRPEYAIGSHAGPGANGDSIGVCFAGNFMTSPPSQAAIQAYLALHQYLESKYGQMAVNGHREVMATACPGDAFPLDEIRQLVRGALTMPTITIRVGSQALQGVLIDQSSYAPVRDLCHALGREVQWDGATNTVVVLPFGGVLVPTQEPKIAVAGQVIPAVLIGQSSYAPVKALAEALGHGVTWDGTTNTVVIN